jgi:hypothetical protein
MPTINHLLTAITGGALVGSVGGWRLRGLGRQGVLLSSRCCRTRHFDMRRPGGGGLRESTPADTRANTPLERRPGGYPSRPTLQAPFCAVPSGAAPRGPFEGLIRDG